METQDYLALEDRYAAHNYAPLDVVLHRAEGVYVYDIHEKRYLDCLAAYSAVNQGHQHPRILEALRAQAGTLALTSRAFRNDRFGPFCKKLGELLGYDKVLMMNTGAEAVETALKAARKWGYEIKGIPDGEALILVFDGNFHGRTTTIVGFSTDEDARRHFDPFTPGFPILPYGSLPEVEAFFEKEAQRIAAVFLEPIQGEAGVVLPPPDFLPGLRKLCDQHKALLICDEIQSGLGRAGELLAHRAFGVRADAVTIGKALSGGLYPVSAFLADQEVMQVFTPGTHGSTYGGNPLACAVAEAALDVLVDEDLCWRSKTLGAHFQQGLLALNSDKVLEVRAMGLWIGLQLTDQAGPARPYCEALKDRGILAKDTHGHTIRFAPPLVITKEEIDEALAQIREVLN